MFKDKKRLISLLLAGAMAASLAVPAFADDENDNDPTYEIEVEGKYEAQPISVVISNTTAATVIINPYSLPVPYDNGKSDNAQVKFDIPDQQIVTKTPMYIVNQGGTKLDVKAKVSQVTVEGAEGKTPMKLGTMVPVSTSTAKEAYIYLEAKKADLEINKIGETTIANITNVLTAGGSSPVDFSTGMEFVPDVVAANIATATGWGDKLVLSTTKDVESTKALVTLEAATVTAGGTSAADNKFADGCVAALRLSGSVVASPKEAWTADDTFSTTIAFTFIPA